MAFQTLNSAVTEKRFFHYCNMSHFNKCWLFVMMLCCHTYTLVQTRDVCLLQGKFVNQNVRFEAPMAVSTNLRGLMTCSLWTGCIHLKICLRGKLRCVVVCRGPVVSKYRNAFTVRLKQSCLHLQAQSSLYLQVQVVLSSSSGSSLIFIFRLSQSCFHLQAQEVLSSSSGSGSLLFIFRLRQSCLHLHAQAVMCSSSDSSSRGSLILKMEAVRPFETSRIFTQQHSLTSLET